LASPAQFDHLIVAATTLEEGEDFIAARVGARPQRGGRHVAMGTHNSLLRLDERSYLEVIAIDPDGRAPERARWFELDRPAMQASLKTSPRLVAWAARCANIDAARAACLVDPGPAHPMSRGELSWRITIADDGALPAGGALPILLAWPDQRHPVDTLLDSGVRLTALAAAHPEPERIRAALRVLGLSDVLQVTYEGKPRLAAMLRSRNGTITL
jgi:hypothetical protein